MKKKYCIKLRYIFERFYFFIHRIFNARITNCTYKQQTTNLSKILPRIFFTLSDVLNMKTFNTVQIRLWWRALRKKSLTWNIFCFLTVVFSPWSPRASKRIRPTAANSILKLRIVPLLYTTGSLFLALKGWLMDCRFYQETKIKKKQMKTTFLKI